MNSPVALWWFWWTAVGPAPQNVPARRSSHAYRADVDGLRAVAVLAVVAYHLDHDLLPGGFTGVDIFFVISGFVVTGSLLSRPSPTVGDFLAGFYSRRVKRLAPALPKTNKKEQIRDSFFLHP